MNSFVGKFGGMLNFDANSFASKFGVFVTKILAKRTPTEVVSTETVLGTGLSAFTKFILELIFKFLYLISRFAMNLIDFFQVIVNKLSGISSVGKSYDINDDFQGNPIFRFLLNDRVLRVFNIMIGVAIVLLIVFVIIAIVKSDLDAATNDGEGAKGPIIRRALKSVFLFLAMPIFLFVFILGTNAILNSVNAAFQSNSGAQATLGGNIFIASSYEANRYRTYADRGERAPILFDFEDPAFSITRSSMTSEEIRDAYESWTNAKQLYNNFAYQSFDDYAKTVVYRNGRVYNSYLFGEYEDFVTTPEEYYVMADFIDYAVTHALEYYIKPMDDKDIDWDAVRQQIGNAMYYSIVNNMKFSVGYNDTYDIAKGEDSYVREYANSIGAATTPIADAVNVMQMILAVGNYTENIFKVLERVPGYVNYVRWAAEMALVDTSNAPGAESASELMRVYELTKYTYNTLIEEVQEREPQLCVQYNGQYYAVEKLPDDEIANNGGQYKYVGVIGEASKVDRVSVDHRFIYDDGTEYLNQYGEAIILPKDKLSVKFKQVSWPEKIYNDLLIVFGDVFKAAITSADGNWIEMQTERSSSLYDGTINIPTAFISPSGLVMAELFLGTRLETEEGLAAADATYASVYSDAVLEAVIKAISGEEKYVNVKAQIEVYEAIFDNMMAAILDDAARQEGVKDVDDSVSINTYKQYLSSIMMSDDFMNYFGDVANAIIAYNIVLREINKNSQIPAYTTMEPNMQDTINSMITYIDGDSLNYSVLQGYLEDKFYCYGSSDSNSTSTLTTVSSGSLSYSWDDGGYRVRAAADVSLSGVDIEKYYSNLLTQRKSAYERFSLLGRQQDYDELVGIDEQIYSLFKYLIKTSFRDAITNLTTSAISITLNDNTYNVLLTLSTTQIAEFAFGGQLKTLGVYDSDSDFLFVDPTFPGIMTVTTNENNKIIGFTDPFGELKDFVKKFGDISIALNSSNFVEMAYGAIEYLFAEDFETAFTKYICDEILVAFPDIARTAGILSPNVLIGSGGNLIGIINVEEGLSPLVSWEVVLYNKTNKTFTVKISYTDKNGELKTVTKEISPELPSAENIVRSVVEFWGMDYEKSTKGYVYDVVLDESGNPSYALIDDVKYFCIEQYYASVRGDNSVVVDSNAENNNNSGYVLRFVNGKNYLVNTATNTVIIGDEIVGKTFSDYRRGAMAIITDLDTRNGETDVELKDRFLSLLYFMSAGESKVGDNYEISTETYSKHLVKRLAGEENRPEENLVGKEYSTDFNGVIRDENDGIVFIICSYNVGTEKYEPILVSTDTSNTKVFASKYVLNPYGSGEMKYPIVARGVIDTSGNPTAIRLNSAGNIEFYRDNIYIVNASDMKISAYYQSIEDVRVKTSVVSTIVNGITKIFSGGKSLTEMILEKIPRLYADSNLSFAYGSERSVEATAKQAKFEMSYNFRTLGIDYFYSVGDINIIILFIGTLMLFSAIFAAAWGLIQRIWDMTVLFIISPPIIATIPVSKDDKNGRFITWRDKMVSSVLSVYGIVIGLNVFFMFVPLISNLNVFSSLPANSYFVKKFGSGAVDFMNKFMQVVFLFAAIGLIRRAPKMLQPLITGNAKEQDIFSKGEATQQNVKAAIDTVKDHVSGQYLHDKALSIAGTAKNMVPGAAVAQKAKQAARRTSDFAQKKSAEFAARKNGVPKAVAKLAAKDLGEALKKQRMLEQKEKARKQEAREKREAAREQRETPESSE